MKQFYALHCPIDLCPVQRSRLDISFEGIAEVYRVLFAQERKRLDHGLDATPLPLLRYQGKEVARKLGFFDFDASLYDGVADFVHEKVSAFRDLGLSEEKPYDIPKGVIIKNVTTLFEGGYLFLPWLGYIKILGLQFDGFSLPIHEAIIRRENGNYSLFILIRADASSAA